MYGTFVEDAPFAQPWCHGAADDQGIGHLHLETSRRALGELEIQPAGQRGGFGAKVPQPGFAELHQGRARRLRAHRPAHQDRTCLAAQIGVERRALVARLHALGTLPTNGQDIGRLTRQAQAQMVDGRVRCGELQFDVVAGGAGQHWDFEDKADLMPP